MSSRLDKSPHMWGPGSEAGADNTRVDIQRAEAELSNLLGRLELLIDAQLRQRDFRRILPNLELAYHLLGYVQKEASQIGVVAKLLHVYRLTIERDQYVALAHHYTDRHSHHIDNILRTGSGGVTEMLFTTEYGLLRAIEGDGETARRSTGVARSIGEVLLAPDSPLADYRTAILAMAHAEWASGAVAHVSESYPEAFDWYAKSSGRYQAVGAIDDALAASRCAVEVLRSVPRQDWQSTIGLERFTPDGITLPSAIYYILVHEGVSPATNSSLQSA